MRTSESTLEPPLLPYAADAQEMSAFILTAVEYLLIVQEQRHFLHQVRVPVSADQPVVRRQSLKDLSKEQAFYSNQRLNEPLFERCLLQLIAESRLIQTPHGVRPATAVSAQR